ncbi:DUF4340 domain-containing protein [Kiritimatiella glycovorans]|uniref:DUF4340 domain-containing protein n=1 Tax=Kiritimatiella glycovorans TaxID=1307763 RepID=A0A0G3EDP8_9BACT|nr:DUF4340 domain-containing protein [Kiritimatiella glycovorans]AKJ63527.1 hypothetical protein L21SP4_00244 [Kiritimatiella glycovorans]
MLRTTTWIMVAGALGAAALVWWTGIGGGEARLPAAGDRAMRFSLETMSAVRFERGDTTLECARRHGAWQMLRPSLSRVDHSELDRITSSLHTLEVLDRIDLDETATLKEYGLENPRARVAVRDNRGEHVWLVGRSAPLSEGVYLRPQGEAYVLRTEDRVLELIPESAARLRDRSLFHLADERVRRIDVRRDAGALQLVRHESGWSIRQPVSSAARDHVVEDWLNSLYGQKIHAFIADEVSDLAGYGLQASSRRISLGAGEDEGESLVLGDSLPEQPGMMYAKYGDDYSIFAVSNRLAELLDIPLRELRDPRLVPASPAELDRIELRRGSDRVLLRRRDPEGWAVSEPPSFAAESSTVDRLLKLWTSAEVDRYLQPEEWPAGETGETCWHVEFSGQDERVYRFTVAAETHPDGGHLLRSEDSEMPALVSDPLLPAVSSDPLFYRRLTVLELPREKIRRVELRGSGRTIEYDFEADESGDAPDWVRRLIETGDGLRAVRYVQSAPGQPERFGLDAPPVRITFLFRGAEDLGRVLLLGKEIESGYYARFQGRDPVFVLPRDAVESLTRSLRTTEGAAEADGASPARSAQERE